LIAAGVLQDRKILRSVAIQTLIERILNVQARPPIRITVQISANMTKGTGSAIPVTGAANDNKQTTTQNWRSLIRHRTASGRLDWQSGGGTGENMPARAW
jgi:hypothetical protein